MLCKSQISDSSGNYCTTLKSLRSAYDIFWRIYTYVHVKLCNSLEIPNKEKLKKSRSKQWNNFSLHEKNDDMHACLEMMRWKYGCLLL